MAVNIRFPLGTKPGRYSYEELTNWLHLEVDLILPMPGCREYQPYHDAIDKAAVGALVDFLANPKHRRLSRDKDPDGPTLYRTVAAQGLVGMHVTGMMWQTSTDAADAVVIQLEAGGCEPVPRPPLDEKPRRGRRFGGDVRLRAELGGTDRRPAHAPTCLKSRALSRHVGA